MNLKVGDEVVCIDIKDPGKNFQRGLIINKVYTIKGIGFYFHDDCGRLLFLEEIPGGYFESRFILKKTFDYNNDFDKLINENTK